MEGSQAPEVVVHNGIEAYYPTDNKSGFQQHASAALPPKPHKEIMGLRRSTFWLLAILLVVVLAAAVGGGVGGSMAVSRAKSSHHSSDSPSTNSSSPALTNTTLFIAPTNAKLPLECDKDGQETSVSWFGTKYKFVLTCTSDRPGGDVLGMRALSLKDCCISCVSFAQKLGNEACTGVVFSESLDEGYANCYLKNGSFAQMKTASGVVAAEFKL